MRAMRRMAALMLLAGVATACLGSIASVQSNVPSSRLTDEEYTSPNGEFRVRVPALVHPGARIDEAVGPSGEMGAAFADELGSVYVIQWARVAAPLPTLESIAQDFSTVPAVKESSIVNLSRGRELRMAGLHAAGSPLLSQTRKDGDLVVKRLDLVEAWSISFVGETEYRVKAGVTVVEGATAETLIPRAKTNLDQFLTGLVIQSP